MAAVARCSVLVAVGAAAWGCASGPPEPLTQAVPDEAWNAAFTRVESWNGGDIAHSIDLGDGRTLWLFGDSIFGPVRDGRRVGDQSRMLRAGVARHPTPRLGEPPDPASIRFAGPEPVEGAGVVAWAAPAPGLFPPGSWYWLMNDGVRVRPDRLVLFATAIGPSGNPDGMWNFRRVGGAVITIDNPGDPPDRWTGTQAINPLVTPTPRFGEPAGASENHALAIVEWPPGFGFYCLFGARAERDGPLKLIVARAAAGDLDRPAAWLPLATDPASMPRVPDEFTVQAVRIAGRPALVLISSEPFVNRSVWARTARKPEGPWSDPVAVYDAPDEGPTAFMYAAKGHAPLSRPGELLVTYAVNADFGRVFAEASLYRPRFVRVPLTLLPKPPD